MSRVRVVPNRVSPIIPIQIRAKVAAENSGVKAEVSFELEPASSCKINDEAYKLYDLSSLH